MRSTRCADHKVGHAILHQGAELTRGSYSLIVAAKLNDVDLRAWLADVLDRIADYPASRLDQLLPWNWRHHCCGASGQFGVLRTHPTNPTTRLTDHPRLGVTTFDHGWSDSAGHNLFATALGAQ